MFFFHDTQNWPSRICCQEMQQLTEQRRNAKEPENPTSQRTKTQLRRSRGNQKRNNCWTCKMDRIPQPTARGRAIKDHNDQRAQHYLGKMETLPKRKRKWLCQSEHPCKWNTKTKKTELKTQTPKPRVGTHARPLDDAVLKRQRLYNCVSEFHPFSKTIWVSWFYMIPRKLSFESW